ncbi:ShlB/FhaC/HecB family hemolysin secretion/activation protein [Phascolarctobacterium sp.]|uniref:ShlB/FhaC/HecB family hemolysin secretion/activation protein n=1 Tax=Phascolarctobacterium sp. TaxID=2049039 RepID=UPI002A8076FB|nr:ShlB/FhaC/HecB family hemolysin secretion/activation protein [Phascolarctobacterium sp.]MDY5045555.1 ShlB/FhaC/HecB family hemolysin secretion/activation protein [Phascolarctobacterium sp.]
MHKKHIASLITLACLSLSNVALAAPDNRIANDAGIQMNRMRNYLERERVNRQIAEDRAAAKNKVESEAAKQTAPGEVITFELKKIVTDASAVLTDAELDAIIKPYEGKQVQLNDIYAIVDKINALYNDKGYVTCRAFLPPQTITDGTVKLLLVEGRTGSTIVNNNKYTKTKYITNRMHLAKGEIANIKQLNKDLLLFNATNSTQLRIMMKAGTEPGTTDYEITAYEPMRDTWTIFEDNAGSDTSGEYRTGLFFNTKSLSGHCDALSLGTVISEGTKAANVMYSRSLGRSGTKMNLVYSTNAVEVVKGEYEDMIKGHANSYAIGFTQPIVVNETTRTELSLDYNRQNSKTDFMPAGTRFNIVDDSVQDFSLGFAITNYGASHVFYQKHSYVRGYSESAPDMSAQNSQNFGFYKFNAMYQKLYKAGQMWSLRADAQWSGSEGMVSSRQFYMGGMYSVRGYKENYLGGDGGFTFSAEYAVPVINKNTSAFTFFDYGHVYGNGQSDDQHNVLSSVGLGIRSTINQYCSASLILGIPLQREFSAEKVSKTRLHFIVNGQF